jgi:hypothetical protein
MDTRIRACIASLAEGGQVYGNSPKAETWYDCLENVLKVMRDRPLLCLYYDS